MFYERIYYLVVEESSLISNSVENKIFVVSGINSWSKSYFYWSYKP